MSLEKTLPETADERYAETNAKELMEEEATTAHVSVTGCVVRGRFIWNDGADDRKRGNLLLHIEDDVEELGHSISLPLENIKSKVDSCKTPVPTDWEAVLLGNPLVITVHPDGTAEVTSSEIPFSIEITTRSVDDLYKPIELLNEYSKWANLSKVFGRSEKILPATGEITDVREEGVAIEFRARGEEDSDDVSYETEFQYDSDRLETVLDEVGGQPSDLEEEVFCIALEPPQELDTLTKIESRPSNIYLLSERQFEKHQFEKAPQSTQIEHIDSEKTPPTYRYFPTSIRMGLFSILLIWGILENVNVLISISVFITMAIYAYREVHSEYQSRISWEYVDIDSWYTRDFAKSR